MSGPVRLNLFLPIMVTEAVDFGERGGLNEKEARVMGVGTSIQISSEKTSVVLASDSERNFWEITRSESRAEGCKEMNPLTSSFFVRQSGLVHRSHASPFLALPIESRRLLNYMADNFLNH